MQQQCKLHATNIENHQKWISKVSRNDPKNYQKSVRRKGRKTEYFGGVDARRWDGHGEVL